MHKYKVGDKVIYTNDYGVCWGLKTIIGLDVRTNKPVYDIDPTDTPWYAVNEKNLTLADSIDVKMVDKLDYFQQKYGFEASAEQRAELLD